MNIKEKIKSSEKNFGGEFEKKKNYKRDILKKQSDNFIL